MRFSSLVVFLVVLASCSKQSGPVFRRAVLLPIENLTSDERGAVTAQALRLGIWDSLHAQQKLLASMAGHRRDLPGFEGAFVVDGYVAEGRFELRVNDQPVRCAGSLEDCAGRLAAEIASKVGATARPFPKVSSLMALATGIGLEEAVQTDPLFGGAWLGLSARAQETSGPAGALEVLQRAPLDKLAPFDAGRIRVRMAELQKDRAGYRQAMIALAALAPADVELQERAAREATGGREYAAAMAIYERLLGMSRVPGILNQIAYVGLYSGDRAKAESSADEAARLAPGEPTFADTRGEVAYWFGDFKTAADWFEKAAGMNVTFLGGLDLWKAADAARLAGENARADALLQRYIEFRMKGGLRNPLLIQAVWDWRGARPESALEKLHAAAQTTDRGKALFLLALMSLNKRDFAAAERIRKEMEPATIEGAFLRTLIGGASPPPGLPFPMEATQALYLYLKGDKPGASKALTSALAKMEPGGEGQWRKLDAELRGERPLGLLPPSPDEWLAVLLR